MIQQDPAIQRFIRWVQEQQAIRAMLLTGSRASPNGSPDAWSDYDLLLVVEKVHPFFADRTWLQGFGQVLVAYYEVAGLNGKRGNTYHGQWQSGVTARVFGQHGGDSRGVRNG